MDCFQLPERRSMALFSPMLAFVSMVLVILLGATEALASSIPFIGVFHIISTISSTVPANGDLNPYGVAVVPHSIGKLVAGDVLVSNFNNSANLQGTGTTIVQISPTGKRSLFAQLDAAHLPGVCPGGVGLTTALVVLQRGWVIVGSLPTTDGTSATARAGCLIVLNSDGHPVETISGSQIDGPWDMTALDRGNMALLFVSNVLHGTLAASPHVVNQGIVIRLALSVPFQGQGTPNVETTTVIGSGFPERTDPAALVIGPTGLGLGKDGTLYVADSLSNRIAAIPYALTRNTTAFTGRSVTINGALNDPLGLTIAPNGDILTVNGNNGLIVETTPDGHQIAQRLLNNTGTPPGAGCLFGLQVAPAGKGVYYVDDCFNTLRLLHS